MVRVHCVSDWFKVKQMRNKKAHEWILSFATANGYSRVKLHWNAIRDLHLHQVSVSCHEWRQTCCRAFSKCRPLQRELCLARFLCCRNKWRPTISSAQIKIVPGSHCSTRIYLCAACLGVYIITIKKNSFLANQTRSWGTRSRAGSLVSAAIIACIRTR